jgi:Uncharacterized protein conserved in bacteria
MAGLIVLSVINLITVIGILVFLVLKRPEDGGRDAQQTLRQLEVQINGAARQQGEQLAGMQRTLDSRFTAIVEANAGEARRQSNAQAEFRQEMLTFLTQRMDRLDQSNLDMRKVLSDGLDKVRTANAAELERIRTEVGQKLQTSLAESLKDNSEKIAQLTESTGVHQKELKSTLQSELDKVREGNNIQLEKMRETVDEKLQGTLEKRLGESFKLVSDRLEQVQLGLGEMKNLATDVGGLKRVLSNVKNRGAWGEVQLSRQLEDILTPSQYEENTKIRPESSERVEFAVRLPGRDDDHPVLLPIDSKFPQEDYERLLSAQENGDPAEVATATTALEKAIKLQAATISNKYIHPPYSTDFAIMYLPTEGLFAEAMRISGLAAGLQQRDRVMITGPTTLMSLLNSLQMGFKTLAIEQRSSEVWQVLGAAKSEFIKYGKVWDKLGKQLKTAQNTVDEAGRRTRAVERTLRDIETIDSGSAPDNLAASAADTLLIETLDV